MMSFRQAGATAIPLPVLYLGIASPLAVGDKVGLDAAVLPGRAANPVNGQMGLPFGNGVISAKQPHRLEK